MNLVLFFALICGVRAWTVDLEKIEILASDVEGTDNAAATASAREVSAGRDSAELASDYEYDQDYSTENEMTNIVQNGSQFLERINKTFSEYKDVLKRCIKTNETRNGAPDSGDEKADNICVAVLRNSGDVRRLIAVLFSATGDMRDKVDDNTQVEEELESLVRVAWLLDRLARLTDLHDINQLAAPTARPPPKGNLYAVKEVDS